MKNTVLEQALQLSEEILSNIELNEISLSNIALKTSRLARLLDDFKNQKIFQYEASGYPTTPDGIAPDIWKLLQKCKRTYLKKNKKEELKEYANYKSIEQYENELLSAKESIFVSKDADISLSSANPHQFLSAPVGNTHERRTLRDIISSNSQIIASRKSYIYDYV